MKMLNKDNGKMCNSCRYWGGYSSAIYGKCLLSIQGHSPFMRSACGLSTRNDFSCILHKPKEVMMEKKVSLQVQDPETGEWKELPSKEVAGKEFDVAREALNKRIIEKLIENDQTDNRFDTSDH